MDPNTHSTPPRTRRAEGRPGGLATLTAGVDEVAAENLDQLTDTAVAERVLELRRLLDRLEGQWLKAVAAVDARGAAGADQNQQVGSTAGWLRARLRLGPRTAASSVRTTRALFRGPLAGTAEAVCAGEVSVAHAAVVAQGTKEIPDHLTAEAEPVLVGAARRLDRPRLRRLLGHLLQVADPDGAEAASERRHQRRGLWLAPTFEGMVAVDGLLEPEAGQTLSALEPLARPADANDTRSGSQRNADALAELARRALEGGRLPTTGGVRPQLAVVVKPDSLLGRPGAVGGEAGWAGPLDPEACRRLACDGAITRVVVTGQPGGQHTLLGHMTATSTSRITGAVGMPQPRPAATTVATRSWGRGAATGGHGRVAPDPGRCPSQPLDLGRTTRVISPAQRTALAVRDGGCVFPDCARPLAWCEGHHLVHWLNGVPTDLANLVLLCRAHHRAAHEGGWRLTRRPDGGLTAIPPHRRPRRHPRHPTAA